MSQEYFPIADISGTSYEIGFQHGELFKEKVKGSIDCYREMFADYANLKWSDATRMALEFVPIIESFNADYLQEIQGVADGAGLPFADILALNCRSELVFAGDEARVDLLDGCTSIGATAEATKNGETLVAHNWDWKTSQRKNMVMLRITQQNGLPKIFTVTEAGIIGKTGFNSKGVSVFLNALGTNAPPKGVPLHMVMRAILDCETLTEALKASTKMNIGCCANFLIGHSNGEVLDIEIENEDFDVIYPTDGLVVHTNHFLSPRLPVYPRRDKVKYKFTDTYLRLGRSQKLLNAKRGLIDEDVLKEILSDHVDFPYSICSHNNPKIEPGQQTGTVFSIIINLSKGIILFAKGSPCETEYEAFSLNS